MIFVQNFEHLARDFSSKSEQVESFVSNAGATSELIRHFVHMATLKWLSGKMFGLKKCSAKTPRCLSATCCHTFQWPFAEVTYTTVFFTYRQRLGSLSSNLSR
eukprot:Blabericola_migrator_1__791@NODE_1199_length_5132_cov_13_303850_g617_i2_p5_GENE_NODE_1199_length_5132_cov_13_303850_g617_i2NODE_1199_length_5132_cov_13_303850_g617_i2_p5_ORF_typecomplete_len103_score10_99DUF948/PF06103_11/0_074_NODE_1199_length_5132_cov_13_303850_g617_i240564364